MPIRAAGGVVCAHDEAGRLLVLLIQDRYGTWTLPKGHLKAGESEEAAAAREIFEETGVACSIGPLLGRVSYPVQKKGRWRTKQVAYFRATAPRTPPVPHSAEGISAALWLPVEEAIARIPYPRLVDLIREAVGGQG